MPAKVLKPVTAKTETGVDVPTPTLPVEPILKYWVPEDEATINGLSVPIPETSSDAIGEVVPIPMRVF